MTKELGNTPQTSHDSSMNMCVCVCVCVCALHASRKRHNLFTWHVSTAHGGVNACCWAWFASPRLGHRPTDPSTRKVPELGHVLVLVPSPHTRQGPGVPTTTATYTGPVPAFFLKSRTSNKPPSFLLPLRASLPSPVAFSSRVPNTNWPGLLLFFASLPPATVVVLL